MCDRTAYIFTVIGRSRGERCSPWFAARSATCVVPAADQFTSMAVSRTIANGEDLIAGAACAGVISRRSNSRERTCVRLGKRNWRRSRSLAESSGIVLLNELLDTAVSLSLVSRKQNGETVLRDTSARSYYTCTTTRSRCASLFASYRGLRVRRGDIRYDYTCTAFDERYILRYSDVIHPKEYIKSNDFIWTLK